MASDFERFLGELSATMGIPSAPAPAIRTSRPVATPTPAPSQSPFANASPQQQQMIQQASAGLPPDLVAQIASLAASTAQQAPQVRQQPQMPAAPTHPDIDPNMIASTGMIGAPVQRQEQPKPKESPLAAKEGEGYVMVEYDTGTDAGMVLVAVPERYVETLPESARVTSPVIPGERKDAIAANSQLLEQQPEEIQNGLVPPQQVREEQYPAQAEADAPREQRTQEPLMRVQDAEGRVHLVPDADEVPEGMTLVHRAGEEMPDTRLQGVSSPTVIGEKTPQQQQDMYEQNVVEVDAEGNPAEDQLVVITVDEIRAIGDPEANVFADQLEQSGLTEYRSDMYYVQDAESGRITAITEDEYEQMYPEAGPLEPMTTNLIRDKYGMNTEANELEAQGIFVIPDGQMAVKRNGRWVIVMASETPPSDAENVVYGGESRPLDDKSILGGVDDLASVPGSLFRGGISLLAAADKPRQFNVGEQGERAYEDVVNNRDEYIANAEKNRADRESGGIIGGIRRAEDWVEQNQVDPYKDFENWVKAEPEAVIDAYENGYTDPDTGQEFTGGRAVWERYMSTQPWITRASGEIIMDPFTGLSVGGGVSRSVGRSLMRGNVPQRLAGRFLDKTGRVMQLPDAVIDTMVARGASKTWNTLTTPTVRATIQKNLADDIASLTGSPAARWVARKFEHTPEAQIAIQTGDVNRAQSTLIDQQPVYREGDLPTSASGDMPSPDAPVGRTPSGPDSPTPGDASPSGFPSSSVDTPPIPRDVIDRLPPAQKALYDNWDQQPLDLAGQSPFAYREDGSIGTDWDFAGPRTDDEGRKIAALLDEDDYARRIIDETFVSLQKQMPDRWKFFVESHDPKVRRFIQRERYIQGRSIDSKALRKDFDYAQKQLSQVNEARYIVDDLIPDLKAAFPDQAIPEYRYKNTAKNARLTTAERDDVLIEAAVFGNEQQARDARDALGNKAFGDNRSLTKKEISAGRTADDKHLIALMPEIESLRSRYLDRLGGRMPDPRPAPTPGRIPTDPIPGQQAPRPGGLTPAPEPTGTGLSTDVAPSPPSPRRQGLGIAPQNAVEANAVKRREAQKWFRPAMRKAGVKDEWISAYARRQGLDSSADLPVEEMQRLVRLARSDAKAVRDLLESSFDASAPRGVSGIEQMSPNDIKTTWRVKKSDLEKNLGVDRSLQPRAKPFDEEHVLGIVDNYVPERMDPIIAKRGNDGETYVVAGHNRLEAARRLNVDVPVRYTDAVGEDLLRLSRETNMQNLGMSQTNIAQSVRQMVDEGQSFEEIGRALKLSPDGSARTPATMAERYYNFSFLREGSNLHRLTDQGILPMEVSANAGRGIRNGNLTQAEVESLAFRVSDNRLNPKYFDGIIKRAIRRAEEGKSSQMGGLFEGMNVTDNLKAAEDEFMGLWDTWRKTHDEWRPLNEKKLDGSLTRQERTRLAQLEADKVRLADDLDIPENKLYMREPTAEGFLNRDYDVDGSMAPARDEVPTAGAADNVAPAPDAPTTTPEFGSGPIVDDAPRLDADGNPIRSMADNPDARPLLSARQTASPGWQPAPMNHSRNQPTAAVMAYSSPLGQWEFPNLNLGKLRDRLNRWAGDPIGDRNVTSEFLPNTGTTTDRATRTPGTEYWGDASRAPEPEVKTIRGRVVDEGSYDHHLLTQTFDDGEQIIQRWERLANEYEGRGLTAQQAEVRAGDQVMADWGEQAIKNYDAKNGTEFHAKYVREYERLTTTGKKADRPTGTMAQMKAANRAMGDSNRVVSFYDETLGVLREMTLYNALTGPRYIMTQLVGNTITAMITGNFRTIGRALGDYKASYQQMSGRSDDWVMKMLGGVGDGELSEATLRRGIRELEGQPKMVLYDTTDRHMMEWGVAGTRDDVLNVVRDEITDVGANTRFSRLRLGSMNIDKMTKGVFASKSIRDMANAFDLSYRKAMYGHTLKINNGGARIALRNRMMDTMPSSLPTSQFDELWDELPEVFGAHRIREVFGEVDAKWADRMARDWQSAIRKMDLDARDKTYKLFFTGHERNADKVLRRVVFFHYWMSRATPLYTEALMRNPAMLRAYVRMLEEIKEQEESGKFGSAVNGFWEFMSTPFGYNIFIRPDAFLQTVFALDQGSDFTPEGETFLGTIMRKTPLMINPLIDSAANLLGIKGDTFAPDPLMLGQWSNLVTNGANFLESRFGIGDGQPNKNLYSEFWTNKVRTHTSGHLGLPKLDAVDSTQYARRDINYFIMEVAEEQGLDPVGVEAMAAMDDPDSPLYKAGYSRYSNMKLTEHGLRFLPVTSPFYPKVRQERGDETRYIINTAEPGSSEREEAFIQRAIAQTSDPEARALTMQQREYTRLGPEDAREAYSTYNGILYGGLSEPVTIDGVAVNDWILMGMSKDDRQKAADAWAEQTGNTENVETIRKLRKEYRDAHPEYNDYIQWRFSVSDYEGGVIKYWSDLAEGNPNAERYLSGIEDADPDMIEMELTSVTAYMQYKGIRPTIYDPNPISTNSGTAQPYNPAGTSGGSRIGYGTGPSTTIEEDIAKYESDMAEFTAKYGNPQNMTPPMRAAMSDYARQNGDSVPRLSSKAQEYLEWAAAQPPGSDTSVPAYERWKGVEDTSEEEQGLVGSNQQDDSSGINELLSILQL